MAKRACWSCGECLWEANCRIGSFSRGNRASTPSLLYAEGLTATRVTCLNNNLRPCPISMKAKVSKSAPDFPAHHVKDDNLGICVQFSSRNHFLV
jgi:hypothetical protein